MNQQPLTSALLASIDRHFDTGVEFLSTLVKMPSDNPPGDCASHAEKAALALESFGLTVERYPLPHADVARAGMISATNLVVRHRFGDGPVIARR